MGLDKELVSKVKNKLIKPEDALVADRRGLLAELATAISSAEANIDNVSIERPDGGSVLAMFFGVQVRDRHHLAQVMRALKHVPEVKRVSRART